MHATTVLTCPECGHPGEIDVACDAGRCPVCGSGWRRLECGCGGVHAAPDRQGRFRCPITGEPQGTPRTAVSAVRAARELSGSGTTTVEVWLSGQRRFVEPSTPRTLTRELHPGTTNEEIEAFARSAVGCWHLHEESCRLLEDVLATAASESGHPCHRLELRLSHQPGPRRACVTVLRR